MSDSTPLIAPGLAGAYAMLAPIAEALLRVIVGLALVPHGLRMTFGCFAVTELVFGPVLALGLFTRLAAVPIVIFLAVSNVERTTLRMKPRI